MGATCFLFWGGCSSSFCIRHSGNVAIATHSLLRPSASWPSSNMLADSSLRSPTSVPIVPYTNLGAPWGHSHYILRTAADDTDAEIDQKSIHDPPLGSSSNVVAVTATARERNRVRPGDADGYRYNMLERVLPPYLHMGNFAAVANFRLLLDTTKHVKGLTGSTDSGNARPQNNILQRTLKNRRFSIGRPTENCAAYEPMLSGHHPRLHLPLTVIGDQTPNTPDYLPALLDYGNYTRCYNNLRVHSKETQINVTTATPNSTSVYITVLSSSALHFSPSPAWQVACRRHTVITKIPTPTVNRDETNQDIAKWRFIPTISSSLLTEGRCCFHLPFRRLIRRKPSTTISSDALCTVQ